MYIKQDSPMLINIIPLKLENIHKCLSARSQAELNTMLQCIQILMSTCEVTMLVRCDTMNMKRRQLH